MKTTKGGKVMNPTDAYRKELRKKELKRNKKERKKVREVGILKKDPEQIIDQIQKLETMKADGALDKARKHKKRQLEDTLNLVMKKRKEYEEKMKEKGETPVMFSHLGPVKRRPTAEEEEREKHPLPEDSVYYHPTLNPTGAPPPGKPPMYKSSIGPRIPLSSGEASSSNAEEEDAAMLIPPPPPPPPLPENSGGLSSVDGTASSLPMPPSPPPPKPIVTSLPLPPPPPPLPQSMQPPPPGTGSIEREGNDTASSSDDLTLKEPAQVPAVLPPPPPPPGMLLKSMSNQSESVPSEANTSNPPIPIMAPPPPPPPRQQPQMHGPTMIQTLQPDLLPLGLPRYPPPPLMEMRPPLPPPGLPSQSGHLGMMVPPMPRPGYGLPGPPPMMRPPLPPGPPPSMAPQDANVMIRSTVPPKPSFVKSAASTVVKRPLAQHTPELTAMIPASVRVRRETVLPKPKPKPSTSIIGSSQQVALPVVKSESANSSSGPPKMQSIDDSYTAFLEDMKALGALDR
ncbi:hypothetical protein ACFE04_017361 [Oxalis oulophora]